MLFIHFLKCGHHSSQDQFVFVLRLVSFPFSWWMSFESFQIPWFYLSEKIVFEWKNHNFLKSFKCIWPWQNFLWKIHNIIDCFKCLQMSTRFIVIKLQVLFFLAQNNSTIKLSHKKMEKLWYKQTTLVVD